MDQSQIRRKHFSLSTHDWKNTLCPLLCPAAALAKVNWRAVDVDEERHRIAFAQPGMALTLNGGGQGYVTDRVTDVLRSHGLDRMLVDMGEPRALSVKPDGSAWRIGIANPADTSRIVTTLDVVDQCVATSGGLLILTAIVASVINSGTDAPAT